MTAIQLPLNTRHWLAALVFLLSPLLAWAQTPAAQMTPVRPAGTPPPEETVELTPLVVTGSRIARTDVEGPSPLSVYDESHILATGAFTLADFLRTLPQNYTGISSGRGSTPNELNPEFGQRTETTSPAFNMILGVANAPPGQTGVSGAGLRGLGSGSTLVLIDGRRLPKSAFGNQSSDSRQGFVDLNTIPLGMIERIEVLTDGASAIYGADAVAGVINVILKKDYIGTEVSSSFRGTFDGGARERRMTLTTGFARDRLRGTVSIDYYDRAPLKASQREFSANQNRRNLQIGVDANGNPVFGRDFRLNWGYPGVIQAQVGNLNGVLDPNGNPTRVAIVPSGTIGTGLSPNQFRGVAPNPGTTFVFPSGQSRGNTAEFLDLIPMAESLGGSFSLTYSATDTVELYTRVSYTERKGMFNTQPGVNSASATTGFGSFSTIVPALIDGQPNPDNPFGQNIMVGLYHYEFGSTWQRTKTESLSGIFGIRGFIGDSWRWDLGLNYGEQDSSRLTRNFNGSAITAALSNPNPAQRLNPFRDARVFGVTQESIYSAFEQFVLLEGTSKLISADLTASGEIFELPAGPVQIALGAEFSQPKNRSVTSTTPDQITRGSQDLYAMFGELSIPLFSKENALPGARRLELSLAARYEDNDRAGSKTVPKVGVSWSPIQSLLFRTSYSTGFRAPDLTEYQVATSSFNSTVTDPRRNPPQTTGVLTLRGSNPDIRPETSTNRFYGVILEPQFLPGFSFQVDYHITEQKNAIRVLGANAVVLNEDIFPGRVTRAAPTPEDIALGQPGRITQVDTTLLNFGLIQNESVDYRVNYNIPWDTFGRFRVTASASRTMKSRIEVAPGQPLREDLGDTFAPPKWRMSGSVFWSKGPWTASSFVSYLSGFDSNRAGNTFAPQGAPSYMTMDLRGSYEFTEGFWRGYGKRMRLGLGIGNVFNEQPPYSDTIFGYNGGLHSPLGRTYEVSLNLPF